MNKITRNFIAQSFVSILTLTFCGCSSNSQPIVATPIIEICEWGKITVKHDDKTVEYRDCKIWPSGSKKWDWSETGTYHKLGVQAADIADFIDSVDEIIITRGMDCELHVTTEVVDYVTDKGKILHVGATKKMCNLYNKLTRQGKKVGILIHSTC